MNWWLGLAVGVAAALVTDSLVAGLLAGAGLMLAAVVLRSFRRTYPLPDAPSAPRTAARATSITVVCKTVTPERQEWVSSKTGRLYDVLSHHGLPDAQPGAEGVIVLTPSGWRVEPRIESRARQAEPPFGRF